MDCPEVAPFVSALFDGEQVPRECAEHIDGCAGCRERLRAYAAIGAELRLMASRSSVAPKPSQVVLDRIAAPGLRGRLGFLKTRVLVPRFAVMTAVVAFVALSIGLVAVQAQSQSHPLWFAFELLPQGAQASDGHFRANRVAQAGFDDLFVDMGPVWGADHKMAPGQFQSVGSHVAVTSIKDGRVELAIRSRRYPMNDPAVFEAMKPLADLKGHSYTYTPGQALEIPVEGGGTLVLRGAISDTQPRISMGLPVDPAPGQIVLNQPTVIRDREVVANEVGGGTIAEDGLAAFVSTKEMGRLTIALQPFAGAVRAEANWGRIAFTSNGHTYQVLTVSPICGGEQPHAVWVAVEPDTSRENAIGNRLPGAPTP